MPYKDKNRQREYQCAALKKRRASWLAANGPCAKCGSTLNLEVDHVDGAEKVSHRIWSWSEKRRIEELSKCQVLCHNCHVDKTTAGLDRLPCGTRAAYARGCRCEACCEALREHWRRRRAK